MAASWLPAGFQLRDNGLRLVVGQSPSVRRIQDRIRHAGVASTRLPRFPTLVGEIGRSQDAKGMMDKLEQFIFVPHQTDIKV